MKKQLGRMLLLIILTFYFAGVSTVTRMQNGIKMGIAVNGAECLKEIEATSADLQNLVDHVRPTTRGEMCLITCVHKKVGIQNQEGKFDEEGIYKFFEPFMQDDSDYYAVSRQHFLDCAKSVPEDDDECVTGAGYNDCIIIGGKEKGLLD